MTTVQQFLAQQEANFWEQKAQVARENAAWHAASYQSHGVPANINQQVGNPYSQVSQVARANVTGREVCPPQQTVSYYDPGLQQARAQAAARQARAQQAQQAALVAEIRDAITQYKNVEAAVYQAAHQATAPQPQRQTPTRYQYATSSETGQPSRNRAIINQSLGLSSVEPVPQPEQLPVSPYTGKPSKLRAMVNRSVGMK